MSQQVVLVVHAGQRLSTDASSFHSLDAFKSWLSSASSIPPADQILLTASGRQAKLQSLNVEPELFLYNRQLLFARSDVSADVSIQPTVKPISLTTPPDSLADQNDLGAWQDLFRNRRAWAREVVEKSASLNEQLQRQLDGVEIMKRGVGVAVGNLDSHIHILEQRYGEAREWSDGLVQEQQAILDSIVPTHMLMKSLPGDERFLPLLPLLSHERNVSSPAQRSTLNTFFPEIRLQKAAQLVKDDLSAFVRRTSKLNSQVESVIRDAGTLFNNVDKADNSLVASLERDASQLLEEVGVLAQKIASDHEHVLTLPAIPRSISQASKMALLHTKDYLPALTEFYTELGELVNKGVEQRNGAATQTTQNMRKVAGVEASFAEVDALVKSLDFASSDEESLTYASLVAQFPFVYGAMLLESVRRREWSEKIRSESAALAEDIAGYREEEERRRKKWAKNIGNVVAEDSALGRVLDFELNLQADESNWPEVSREDLTSYINTLSTLDGQAEAVEELNAGVQDLDRPTKRQLKTARNFKYGSIHEAFSGKGSVHVRENDEVKALRESNSKLEDDVKSQKSRVRKLEDLLYRQTQTSRTASGNVFHASDLSPHNSPTPEGMSPSLREPLSRQTSHNSRRTSATKSGEEKALARRIVNLDAELQQERQKRQELERAATGRQERSAQMASELEDTRSTKQDLLANLETQQREFSAERRVLEDDIGKHKLRVEELEDEIERILGSKDNSRLLIEERTQCAERELEQANQTIADLREEKRRVEETRAENLASLRAIHASLSPTADSPGNIAELIDSLEALAERTSRQARDLNQAVAALRSEKKDMQGVLDRKEEEALEAKGQIQSLQEEVSSHRSDLATEQARSTSLLEELEDGRHQLKDLRAKFADGETGSEALKQRVEQQAARASALSTELAQAKSHVNSLDVELSSLQRKHHLLTLSSDATKSSLERRSIKARELTNRLVAFHQELARLLESLGLSIMRRDGVMLIQRSSKLANLSATLPDADGSVPMLPPFQPFETTVDPSLLGWTQAETDKEENDKFNELLARINDFNLTTFSEAVIKLRRDVEWTGKKWKMEARNYRDKYHKAQGEAHDKIAYRSFKNGDLALFLPTRNQATRPWAAFNVGAPHCFLREQDSHRLRNREWLVARITKVEERVVDLSRTMTDSLKVGDRRSVGETSEGGASVEDDNPFELSDGLRWYLLDAAEDKPGAPSTPGLGKSTVASANVDAKGSIDITKASAGNGASAKLNKSLESRRSSSNSKRGSISGGAGPREAGDGVVPSSPTRVEPSDGSLPRKASTSHLRPGSRSSAIGPGPSGLGVEVSRGGQDGAGDEQRMTDPAKAIAVATSPPAAGLLGLFGSPPKTWLRRGNSNVGQEDRSAKFLHPTDGGSKSQGPSPSKARPSPIRVQSSDTANSPTKSSSKAKPSGWESLWSLDLNLEERGKGK